MTIEAFKDVLETTGLPVTYYAFPEGEAPPLPYICYLNPDNNNFAADGTVYYSSKKVLVELYTERREQETEEKVEEALSSFFYEKEATYIDSENCYQILYELEV